LNSGKPASSTKALFLAATLSSAAKTPSTFHCLLAGLFIELVHDCHAPEAAPVISPAWHASLALQGIQKPPVQSKAGALLMLGH
jgi:hypothetical protein